MTYRYTLSYQLCLCFSPSFLPGYYRTNRSSLVGLDINEVRLRKLKKDLTARLSSNPTVRSAQLWSGSGANRPELNKHCEYYNVYVRILVLSESFLKSVRRADAGATAADGACLGVACLEVIEHLPSIEAATNATVSSLLITLVFWLSYLSVFET